jgi:two-component system osmolarity sensor histidine kinase EnvZ
MLAGVSHDLRTPLTRLKLQLAMLPGNSDTQAMKNDIQEMEKMIEGYLEFVKGEGDEQSEYITLKALTDKLIDAAKRQHLKLEADIPEDIKINVRPMAMERALMNIVNNAGQYAKNIWLKTHHEGKYLFITVDDDGPGVPEDKFEEVFRPFYRVDPSRNTATGGVGLGLPIAMEIVHGHGGKIWLEKSEKGGLKVNIRLPV